MLNTDLEASEIKVRPIRVLTDVDDLSVSRYYGSSRRAIIIDPRNARDLYNGRMRCIPGLKYYPWTNQVPLFVYEKSPKSMITGMVRLSPVFWTTISDGSSAEMETLKAKRPQDLHGSEYSNAYLNSSADYRTVCFYFKDMSSSGLLNKPLRSDERIYVSDITKAFKFECEYRPEMLGFLPTDIRVFRPSLKLLTDYRREPWYDKLIEDIGNAIEAFMKDNDMIQAKRIPSDR